jgi:hypothetical protein
MEKQSADRLGIHIKRDLSFSYSKCCFKRRMTKAATNRRIPGNRRRALERILAHAVPKGAGAEVLLPPREGASSLAGWTLTTGGAFSLLLSPNPIT